MYLVLWVRQADILMRLSVVTALYSSGEFMVIEDGTCSEIVIMSWIVCDLLHMRTPFFCLARGGRGRKLWIAGLVVHLPVEPPASAKVLTN